MSESRPSCPFTIPSDLVPPSVPRPAELPPWSTANLSQWRHSHSHWFAPDAEEGDWLKMIRSSLHPSSCESGRYLLIDNDLRKSGLGWTHFFISFFCGGAAPCCTQAVCTRGTCTARGAVFKSPGGTGRRPQETVARMAVGGQRGMQRPRERGGGDDRWCTRPPHTLERHFERSLRMPSSRATLRRRNPGTRPHPLAFHIYTLLHL